LYSDETEADVYVTSLSQIPQSPTANRGVITLELKTYRIGATVLSGTNVANHYQYFDTVVEEYGILSNGTLGINKIISKSTSTLSINRNKNLVSGFNLNNRTVGEVVLLFENNKTYLEFYNENGTKLSNSNSVTTGTKIKLVDTAGAVLDELTIVIYGDVNGDYFCDARDSVIIEMIAGGLLNSANVTAAKLEAADVNRNGTVEMIDAESTDQSGVGLQTISQI
ncbi:MAG: dockerin type I repeat-containing protein, partial [Ruminococcus sp.]|nr:dockerin type I repeat-containing protein [Candidatus Copronaster equi]